VLRAWQNARTARINHGVKKRINHHLNLTHVMLTRVPEIPRARLQAGNELRAAKWR
jgi:hypothetical protein